MLEIEIDGTSLQVEEGSTVIEAAHKLGTYIPHFCYHKKLSIAANCRMCLVQGPKGRDGIFVDQPPLGLSNLRPGR